MAKATLPVNFKDDILNAGMDGKRKFTITQNTDGTYSIEDVTEYDQIGSNFGSAQINATNTAVNASADASKIIDDLATVAANTQKGYMAGALALKEVNQSLSNKQDTLINPLTRGNVINNLTSANTDLPLSAYQGKVLNAAIATKNTVSAQILAGQVTLKNGQATVDLGAQPNGVFLVPVACTFNGDATYAANISIQANRYARIIWSTNNSTLLSGTYTYAYLKITIR